MVGKQNRIVVLALASMLVTGCSIIFIRPTPTVVTNGNAVCGPVVAPILDTIATPALAGAGYFIDSFCTAEGARCERHVSSYVPAMITAAAALYGFWALSHCHEKLEALPRDGAQPFPANAR